MSNLISGKEALIALANGREVLYIAHGYKDKPDVIWGDAKEVEVDDFLNDAWSFKLKPRTITINIEVPAPFDPRIGDEYYHLSNESTQGYGWGEYESSDYDDRAMNFGAWRSEEEIKQVVEALRSVFR